LGNLNVLISVDLHQVPPICDSWVFQPIDDGLNFLGINFWQNKIKCDELFRVMRQQDTQFVEIFNKILKTHQTQ
jgi:hypothetical protein